MIETCAIKGKMAAGAWFRAKINEYKKELVIQLLTETRGNVKAAAAMIDERRARIYRILRSNGLKAKDFRKNADPR
jgi:DNA-binding NtrC family response regulator